MQGIRSKLDVLTAVLDSDQVDVALLQETNLPATHKLTFRRYVYHNLPVVQGETRGLGILVKRSIAHSLVADPIDCGEGVEVMAVTIQLSGTPLTLYNIYIHWYL